MVPMRTLLLTALLLAPTASFAAAFSDVPATHQNAQAIVYVKAEGIVEGYADGTFKADANINRAEFTKIIIEAVASDSEIADCDTSTMSYFSDVPATAWYAPYVCVGRARGIVQGHLVSTGKPYFAPGEPINMVEAAKIITVGFGIGESPLDCSGPNGGATCMEHASQGDVWYKRHIVALADRGAIPLSITDKGQYVTRGEMAEMIYRVKAEDDVLPSRTYDELEYSTHDWVPFSSEHFTLSFKHPAGFVVIDTPDSIRISQAPYRTSEIGSDSAFFSLVRYDEYRTREAKLAEYREYVKNLTESTVEVDGTSFVMLQGEDWGRYEGRTAGRVAVVFFEKSFLEIVRFPGVGPTDFDAVDTGLGILSTFRFSK